MSPPFFCFVVFLGGYDCRNLFDGIFFDKGITGDVYVL